MRKLAASRSHRADPVHTKLDSFLRRQLKLLGSRLDTRGILTRGPTVSQDCALLVLCLQVFVTEKNPDLSIFGTHTNRSPQEINGLIM